MNANLIDLSAIVASAKKQAAEKAAASEPANVRLARALSLKPRQPKTVEQPKMTEQPKVATVVQDAESAKVFIRATNKAHENSELASLIEAFVGSYDHGKPLGSQLDAARAIAQGLIRPVAPGSYSRCSAPVAGFVAGMPDSRQREIDNARKRIELATSELASAEMVGDHAGAKQAMKEISLHRARLVELGAD